MYGVLLALQMLAYAIATVALMIFVIGVVTWRVNPPIDLVRLLTRHPSDTADDFKLFWYIRLHGGRYRIERGMVRWGLAVAVIGASCVYLIGDIAIWQTCRAREDVGACWKEYWGSQFFIDTRLLDSGAAIVKTSSRFSIGDLHWPSIPTSTRSS
ncbi:hypothetical protein [Martelella radicis]|uniref:Uncharacterized protein n=1 Tax=Martelella radicis TaxID=1397476 RepID=A0A7W6KJF8_9HYPH|nr:hypothetical protein [Martelella radicis]MBB4122222.1 hypothetical protein [Martelella radicis]